MATPNTHLTLLLIALLFSASNLRSFKAARILIPHQQPKSSIDFIKSSCSCTTYSDLCFNSLFSYASTIQTSPVQLAHTALSVSFNGTRSVSAAIKQMTSAPNAAHMTPRVGAAMKDYMETVRDSMMELQDYMALMGHLGGKDMGFQLSSVQTWVSAALLTTIPAWMGSTAAAPTAPLRMLLESVS